MARPRALISLGTNSTRLLIVRDQAGGRAEQLEHGSIGTRLGEGLREQGRLGDEAMRRTLNAIEAFVQRARDRGASVACIATSAMRRASNGTEFAARVAALTGTAPRVLDGSEEAAASFAGATYDGSAPPEARVAVIDVGGGSTECAAGRAGRLETATSLEIGAVRLAELFARTMGNDAADVARAAGTQARKHAAHVLEPLRDFAPVDEARAVGGTPLTIAAIAYSSTVEEVSGRIIEGRQLDLLVDRMLGLDLASRRALPGMLAQRADILPAGGIILAEALRRLGAEAVRVETNDLLLGHLLQTGPAGSRA